MKMKLICIVGIILALYGVALCSEPPRIKDPICSQEPAKNSLGNRTCFAYEPRFTYYNKTNECKGFIYGGCGENDNSFFDKIACEAKCV
ncbi:chymotrypsin inhibitor SCI-I-like [Drosophila obscura]|uniref:chymotrypsin inhibitor SCI-I-like n=1 Tax=Drosophila obscura TaxID=7282 RepID=UPI000BA04FDC|nr:chymotrypsin inhibitor SCI-I-like [Drosophila obscura]